MFKWKDMFFNVLPLTVLKRKRETKIAYLFLSYHVQSIIIIYLDEL